MINTTFERRDMVPLDTVDYTQFLFYGQQLYFRLYDMGLW